MKNTLADLNNHLFAQLERLGDEELTPEQIEKEAARGEAIVDVADRIIGNAALQLKAAQIALDAGASPAPYLPAPAMQGAPLQPALRIEGKAEPLSPRFPIQVGKRAP